jgi:threonine dehydrogenase-like Zn-dependent dehydrogenase
VTGHEISAVIKDVGEEVKNFRKGDRVVAEIVTFFCGQCVNCKQGKVNICCNIPSREQRVYFTSGGGFAKYAAWPSYCLHKLPDEISLEEASLMETSAGSVHSLIEKANLTAGESIIIFGPGARGLVMLQIAKALGAYPIIVAGMTTDEEKRLKMATELGADAVINVEKEDAEKVVKSYTRNWGADVVMECAGSPAAVLQGIKSVRPGGRMILSGGGTVTLDTDDLIVKEVSVFGEVSHIWTSWETAITLVKSGKVKLKPLISHVFPLSRWEEAFNTAADSRASLKVLIKPE